MLRCLSRILEAEFLEVRHKLDDIMSLLMTPRNRNRESRTWAISQIAFRRLNVRSQVSLPTCEPAVFWFRVVTCSSPLPQPRPTGG